MDTCIKTRVLTDCCCAGSGEEGVMEDVKKDKWWMNTCIKKEYLLPVVVHICNGEEGVMEDVKRDVYMKWIDTCIKKSTYVDGHMYKSKSTHVLLDTCIQRSSYLHPVAVQVVVKKETCGCIACRL